MAVYEEGGSKEIIAMAHLIDNYLKMRRNPKVSKKVLYDYADWLDEYNIKCDPRNTDHLLPREQDLV